MIWRIYSANSTDLVVESAVYSLPQEGLSTMLNTEC